MLYDKKPKVSVCLPTYGRAKVLPMVIRSVLSQTYEDFEVFISDDASPDNTGEVVNSFKDPRIRYHRNKRNLGVRENWNFAVKGARGEYVLKLDDDDYIHPAFIAKTVSVLEAHPGIGSVYTGFYYAKGYSGEWTERVVDDTLCKTGYIKGVEYIKNYFLLTSIPRFHPSAAVFRYAVAEEAGFFDKAPNDLMFSLALAAKADVGYVPDPLFYYVQHSGEKASYNKNSKSPIEFEPTRLIEDFFDIDFIRNNAALMEIKQAALKKGRITRAILHLFMCRKGFAFGNYLDAAAGLIRKDWRLLLSPLFLAGLIVSFVTPGSFAGKLTYMYKSRRILAGLFKIIFARGPGTG